MARKERPGLAHEVMPAASLLIIMSSLAAPTVERESVRPTHAQLAPTNADYSSTDAGTLREDVRPVTCSTKCNTLFMKKVGACSCTHSVWKITLWAFGAISGVIALSALLSAANRLMEKGMSASTELQPATESKQPAGTTRRRRAS